MTDVQVEDAEGLRLITYKYHRKSEPHVRLIPPSPAAPLDDL